MNVFREETNVQWESCSRVRSNDVCLIRRFVCSSHILNGAGKGAQLLKNLFSFQLRS